MGGGDDNSATERQQATESSKQAARDALNRQFGIGGAVATRAPDRSAFNQKTVVAPYYKYKHEGDMGELVTEGDTYAFDEAGYNAAQDKYEADLARNSRTQGADTGRQTLYQNVRENAYTSGKRGLDEARDEAARKTKFELFARGLNGGSEDINQNAMLGRTYNQGLMDLGAKADLAESQFRGSDEQTRLGLLQSIDAGMDQGSAASSAMEQMRVNADRAAAEASGTSLGDLFANTGLIYNKGQAAQGKAAGTEWWNNMAPSSSRGSKTANGMISQV